MSEDNGNFIGCNEESGISFPDNSKLADLYNLKYFKIDSTDKMTEVINQVLSYSGGVLCEVILTKDYTIAPKLTSEKKPDGSIISKPLEDLYPFLERNEFYSNMIVNDKDGALDSWFPGYRWSILLCSNCVKP